MVAQACNMPFQRGLIVGKFSPLHNGHVYLIKQAQSYCDELVLLSYATPGYPGCTTAVRLSWLRALFPAARSLVVDDAWLEKRRAAGLPTPFVNVPHDEEPEDLHRRFTAWLSQGVLGLTCDAVFTSESYGDGFAAVLAEVFGHSVTHICVDPARVAVPVSATAVRNDARLRSEYLPVEVAASLPIRLLVLGAESTGKTTLCAALGQLLNEPVAEEYGRELWMERKGQLTLSDMLAIARVQVAREDRLLADARRILVCDTSPATTAFYSGKLFGVVEPELQKLTLRAYDLTLLCQPDIPFVQDGTRQDERFRAEQHAYYEAFLKEHGVAAIPLYGPLERRVDEVCRILTECA